ncbi:hypothetical protein HXX02_13850 [Microbulbifer elongatus]|uniref:Globin n=1 Tax=Microbulbifer elongatus TaxID=86173 RepID=A0ABT1P333_9GAMM|nr:hypothetical protein [Microbulbifer elongatus]MCQ3830526.1 hypothetical protein [Microbulbifer elongatus]
MPKVVSAVPALRSCSQHSAIQTPGECTLLDIIGGRVFVDQLVTEFYQAIGKYLSSEDTSEHGKQTTRQAQFISHALAEQAEPVHSARASFLARGLNPALFEGLMEYFEARLLELGFSPSFGGQLVRTVTDLYDRSETPLSIAC